MDLLATMPATVDGKPRKEKERAAMAGGNGPVLPVIPRELPMLCLSHLDRPKRRARLVRQAASRRTRRAVRRAAANAAADRAAAWDRYFKVMKKSVVRSGKKKKAKKRGR